MISLFAGIGGFDLGFGRAGFISETVCEIDKNAQNILRRHFPGARLIDDVRKVGKDTHERGTVDVICGGFPCQDLSVAGKRAGLDGARSGLWWEFARIINELAPEWVVAENVPGLLSSNKGRDFAAVIQWLAERGYGVAWRILDAQYFGVAQRRRRVFIVASLGNGRAAEVLFEREGVSGNTPPRREAGEGATGTIGTVPSSNRRKPEGLIARESGQGYWMEDVVSGTLDKNMGDSGHANRPAIILSTGQANAGIVKDGDPSLTAAHEQPIVFQQNTRDEVRLMGGDGRYAGALSSQPGMKQQNYLLANWQSGGGKMDDEIAASLRSGAEHSAQFIWEMSHASEAVRESGEIAPTLQQKMGTGGNQVPMVGIRRLTPTECERLQGFPDGWTEFGYTHPSPKYINECARKGEVSPEYVMERQADSVRYRQLGNAVAVPVVEWIARRIKALNA